jgi:hypothetical protein
MRNKILGIKFTGTVELHLDEPKNIRGEIELLMISLDNSRIILGNFNYIFTR